MIAAIKQGNELAFRQVFLQLRKKVYGYFLKKIQSPEDAQDLAQQTFLKLWKYRQSLNEAYSIEQQVFHISRSVFIDYLRKQNSRTTRESGLSPGVCYINDNFDVIKQVYYILDRMPAIRRKVFELNRIQGFSYAEIAAALSISLKSVDNHLSKAVRQLKKELTLFPSIVFFSILFS